MSRIQFALLAGLLLASANPAGAIDPSLHWQTIDTPHFHVHFHDGEEPLARRIIPIAERVHDRLSARLGWEPAQPTELVLTDEQDFANGNTTEIPRNRIVLYITPPDELDQLGRFNNWYEQLITHEYTHLLHLDKATGAPAAARRVFGRFLFAFPNLFEPLWMIEGLATFEETDPAAGVGRGESSLYAMLMRTEVEHGVRPFDQVSMSGLDEWPLGTIPYLYGVHFFEFLADRYGEERIRQLVDSYSSNLIPFLVHSNFRQVLGVGTRQLWTDFGIWLKAHYAPQLAAIRDNGIVAGERLTRYGFWTGPARAAGSDTVYFIRNDGHHHPMLMRRCGDKEQPVIEVNAEARLDWNPHAGLLIAQPDIVDNEDLWFDLYHVDPESGAMRRLTHGSRYRYAVWGPAGQRIAAARTVLGESSLDLLDADGRFRETLWRGSDGAMIADLAWSPDGLWLAARIWRAGRGWALERFDLATRHWSQLPTGDGTAGQPGFTPDGHLLYTSDAGGVFNLRRLDPASGAVTTLTNVIGGAFSPTQAGGDLYYIGYGYRGYDLYRLHQSTAANPPRLAPPWQPVDPRSPAPQPVTAAATEGAARPYSPWRSLAPTSWFPVIGVGRDITLLGVTTNGEDALGLHLYSATGTYEFEHGLPGGALGYTYHERLAINAARTYAFGYDSDGNLRRVTQEDQGELILSHPWLSLDRTVAVHAGVSQLQESDVRRFGIAAEPSSNDGVVGLALSYNSTERYVRSISRTDGRDIRLIGETSDVLPSDYSGNVYTLDWREFIPLGGEHVLALRAAEGWGTEQPRPFQLGGNAFTSELAAFLFNQRRYSLRGYPSGAAELTGRRFRLASAEWRFPITRVNRALLRPPMGLRQIQGALFVDSGATWREGKDPDRYYTGIGAELTLGTNLFYLLNADIHLSYAHGLDDKLGEDQTFLTLRTAF